MHLLQIVVLAVIQGLAELLPVSSSAHVILAERWMGLDPTSPELTFLLVMLHSGTMVAVLFYFRKQWRKYFFERSSDCRKRWIALLIATLFTAIVGLLLKAF